MNKQELELAKLDLKGEREVLEEMRRHFSVALDRVNARIEALADRNDLSGIRQRRFQEMLAEQIGGIMDDLGSGCYATLEEYLTRCYEDGFIGTLYDLQKQGIPLAFPLDQEAVARAVTTTADGVKLSKRMYGNVTKLQSQVIAEVTRGFADASHVTQTAEKMAVATDIAGEIKRNVKGRGDQAFRRSMTIVRTEKGRVRSESSLAAMHKAKDAGADVVKQWDSTLDARTRDDHRKLDGQIRELDEPFEVSGHKGMAPHKFGRPEQDINCRCVILQRARAALEVEDKSTKWDGVNQCYVDLSDARNFAEFKGRYDSLVNSAGKPKEVARERLHGLTKAEMSKERADLEKQVKSAWSDYRKSKTGGNYENTVGRTLISLSGDGYLSADVGTKMEGKELQVGSWLARKGHDVRFNYASNEPGDRTPDILLDGELWEVKNIESSDKSKMKKRIDEASRQSANIIVEMSFSSITDREAMEAIGEMLLDPHITRIMMIRNGERTVYEK